MFGLFTRPVELTPAKKSEPEPEQPSSPAFSSRGENEEGVEYTLFGLDGTENEYDQMMKKHMASVDGAASGVDEIGFEDDRECDEEEEANDDNAHRDVEVEEPKNENVEVEEPENENDNDNDNEFQMPNYNIRRSIATKVIAKKVSRGYKLLEEPCDGCEMPLMEIKGLVECKVCPAIMKWVRRQQERQFCMEIEARDVQESNERVVEERCGHEEEIHYQVDNRDECGNAETAEEFEREDFVSEELANSRNASDSPKMHKDVIASQESNTNEDFHLQMGGESVISQERSEQNKEEKKQGRFLSKSQSNDSDNDFESKKYIEERARQIIMDARKTGAWSFESTPSFNEPSLKSAVVSWGDSKMHTRNNTDHLDDSESREQLEERAERIIYETRQKLNISCDSAASVESRNERRMHGINNSMDKSEQSYDSKSRKETLERAEDIIIESRKKLQMGNDVTAAVDFMLSPRSKVRHAQRSWLSWTRSKLSSWDAATMLQASARRFLARKQFLDMMTEKRSKSYCDLVNGRNEENDLVERNEVELGEESNDKVKEDILPDKTENDIYDEVIQTKDSEQSGINNSRTPPEAYSLDGDHDDDDDNMPDKYTTTGPEENSSLCDVPKFADAKDATDESNEYSLRKEPENGSVAEFSCTNSFVKEYGESVVDSSMKTTDECGHRPDPPVAGTQSNSRNVPLPERNAFAKVACKFDDAVTKAMTSVTSLVTCTNSDAKAFEGAIEVGKSQYKSAPSDGSVATISCPKSKRKLASTQIMYRLKQGWKIANASCPTCQLPTMIRPGDMAKICVVCNESGLENNVSMESGTSLVTFGVAAGSNALLPRPIHADNNHQLSRQMSLEISRRLSSGWLVMTYGCPSCKMPLMRSPFDNAEHCLSCGPIPTGCPDSNFALTASSNTSIMDGNNFHQRMNSYHSHNEVSFLHHDNTVDNMIIHSGFNQPSYYAENAPQHIMNPSNFESRRNLEPPSQYYHGGHNLEPISTNNHASRNHTLEPPSPYDHVDYSAPTPNHNRSGEIANAWEQDHELKENSFRDIQTFQRQQASEAALSAIEEAKLRIENARKHIRSSKAMRTPVMFSDVNGMHPNANFTHMRHGSDYFQYE